MDKKSESNQSSQFDDFVATARALGCDEDKDRFESVLGKIAKAKSVEKQNERIQKTRRKNK